MRNQILVGSFEWNWSPTKQQQARFAEIAGRPPKIEENGKLCWGERNLEWTIEEFLSMGATFSITGAKPYSRPIEEVDLGKLRAPDAPAPLNQRCNVVVAGTSVLEINDVTLHTDCCTDALKVALNEGWRILAICVQPDQRRPDYILGRVAK